MGIRDFVVLTSWHCGGSGGGYRVVGFGGASADEGSQDGRVGLIGTHRSVGSILLQDGS